MGGVSGVARLRSRQRSTALLGQTLVLSLLVTSCSWIRGEDDAEPLPPNPVAPILGASTLTLSEWCEVGACVADTVVLPAMLPIDVAIDLYMPPTLGAMTVERLWTGQRHGSLGAGWESIWDMRVLAGQLIGPLPSPPVSALRASWVSLRDGSRLRFDFLGKLVEFCMPDAICTLKETTASGYRLRPRSTSENWVDVQMESGRVVEATSADGRRVSYGYEDGRLTRVTTAAGTTTYGYTFDGLLTSVSGPRDRRTFQYLNGLVAMTTDRLGAVWELHRSADGSVTVRTPEGSSTRYLFAGDVVKEVRDEDRGVLLRREFADGRLTREQRPVDGLTAQFDGPTIRITRTLDGTPTLNAEYVLDGSGRVITSRSPDGEFHYTYDPLTGNVTSLADERGSFRYIHDANGLVVATVDADGYRVDIERDQNGLPVQVTDGVRTTTLAYDAAGHAVEETSGGLKTRAYYDPAGSVMAIVDPGGGRSDYYYDDRGRLSRVDGPLGGALSYDSATGRLDDGSASTGVQGAMPRSEAYEVARDEWGRVTRVTIDGRTTTRSFDDAGNLGSLVTPSGTYTITRTPAGRIASLNAAGVTVDVDWHGDLLLGLRTSTGTELGFDYDASGRLVEARQGPLRWGYSYDEGGRLALVRAPSGTTSYTWDSASRPTSTELWSGDVISYEWLGDVIAAVSGGETRTDVTWDDQQRWSTAVSSSDGTLELERDSEGRLTSYRIPGGSPVSLSYGTDGLAEISTDGHTERWTYNDGELATIAVGDETFDIEWAAPGIPRRISSAGTVLVDATVDAAGRITSVTDSSGTSIAEFAWNQFGLTHASTDGKTLEVERTREGQLTELTTSSGALRVEYADGVMRAISAGDTSVEYEYGAGAVTRSTVRHENQEADLSWEAHGGRVGRFTSSNGDGEFRYDSDGRVVEISYDDRKRPVDYREGEARAEGTGEEFLDDLFTDGGAFKGAGTPVSSGPILELIDALPQEIGLRLPSVTTGHDVAMAALGTAVPELPRPMLREPSSAAQDLVDLVTGMGARVDIPLGPAHRVGFNPFVDEWALDELVRSTTPAIASGSILTRLADDPCFVCRVWSAAVDFVVDIGREVFEVVRHLFDNPVARAVGAALFVVGAIVATFMCRGNLACEVGAFAVSLLLPEVLASDSPSDALGAIASTLLAPLGDLRDPDLLSIAAGVAVIATMIVTRRVYGGNPVSARVAAVACSRRHILCIPYNRYPGAAANALHGQAAGVGRYGVINRSAAVQNRRSLLSSVPTRRGLDRDEWPPAVLRPKGHRAEVAYISPADNRGAGSLLGRQIAPLRDGTIVFPIVVP